VIKLHKIHSEVGKAVGTPESAQKDESLYRQSALFGLKNQFRQAVLQSWASIQKMQPNAVGSSTSKTENNLSRFFECVKFGPNLFLFFSFLFRVSRP
jgi:hypothetical protein